MRAATPTCSTDRDNRLADGVRQLDLFFPFDGEEEDSFQVLWEDGGHRVFCRGWRLRADGHRVAVLAVVPAAEHPPPNTIDRLAHEYGLKDDLDRAWAVRPLELVRERGRTMLVLEDPGGELLEGLLGQPMAVGPFLHCALGLVAAIAGLHQRGLIHKDIKPAHILVDRASGAAHLTGFGIASRLPRQRQARDPPAVIAGTLGLHGPRTDRADEPLDRCPQRPLRGGRHALPDAHRQLAIRRHRADGVGALPYRPPAGAAGRATSWRAGFTLGHHHEAARQDRRGALPDRRRPGVRPPALPGRNGRRKAASTTSRWAKTTRQTGC